MDLQSNFATVENIEFEEKVDIDALVLPSESAHDRKKQYRLEIKETILKLYEELDREKCENSIVDFSQKRSLRISEVVDKLDLSEKVVDELGLSEKIVELESANNKMSSEIISLRAKIVKINEEHKMAMSLNTKTMMGIVKTHEKGFVNKANELSQVKQEILNFKMTNLELSQKVQELENNSSERNQEVKPFSCKFCDKSFAEVHEVIEHIKIHASILKYNFRTRNSTDCRDGLNKAVSLGEELEVKNDNQSKIEYSPNLVNSVKTQHRRKKDNNKNTKDLKEDSNLKQKMNNKGRKMPYSCRFCEKRFINENHWNVHERIHTDGKKEIHKECIDKGKKIKKFVGRKKKYFDLPYGWTKEVVYLKNQPCMRGKIREDIYLISPGGKKIKSDSKLQMFLDENPNIKCDLAVTSTKRTVHREFLMNHKDQVSRVK